MKSKKLIKNLISSVLITSTIFASVGTYVYAADETLNIEANFETEDSLNNKTENENLNDENIPDDEDINN